MDWSVIKIPFQNIAISLAGLMVPTVAGILIRRFKPNIADKLSKMIRPLAVVFILFVVIYGSIVNVYIYRLMGRYPIVLPAAALLPWCGFFFGFVIAKLLRQPMKRAKTIAFETGIQNTGIAIILLKFSLPQPEGDIGSVMPVATAIFTPTPLYIALIVTLIRKRLRRKGNKDDDENVDEGGKDDKDSIVKEIPHVYSIPYVYNGPQTDCLHRETSV